MSGSLFKLREATGTQNVVPTTTRPIVREGVEARMQQIEVLRADETPVDFATEATLEAVRTAVETTAGKQPLTDAELRASPVPVGVTFPATQPVSVASLPLPAGAATASDVADVVAAVAASQPRTVSGTVAVSGVGGTVAVTGGLTDTQLRASAVSVSAASLPLPTGAATAAGVAAVVSAVEATQARTVTGSVAVTNLPATQPVSGTVAVSNFPATQPVSAAALPLPSGAATDASVQAVTAAIEATQARTVTGTVAVSNFPATQPVSAASLPLPAGAATSTKQDTAQSRLDVLATDASVQAVTTAVQALGPLTDAQLRASAVPTDPTDEPARELGLVGLKAGSQTIGAVTAPGAVALALDATAQATRDRLPAALTAGGGVKVGLVDALPTGSNTVGAVTAPGAAALALDATSQAVRDRLPSAFTAGGGVKAGIVDALPAGTNTIGKVDQGTGGASAWKVDGSAVTQPVSAASLPLPAGAATEATLAARLPSAFTAGGGVKTGLVDALPAGSATIGTVRAERSGSATVAKVNASATVVTLLASNASRLGARIHSSTGSAALRVKYGSGAATDDYSELVLGGETILVPPGYSGIVTGIWDVATGSARVTEVS